jgi:hypothetical protein
MRAPLSAARLRRRRIKNVILFAKAGTEKFRLFCVTPAEIICHLVVKKTLAKVARMVLLSGKRVENIWHPPELLFSCRFSSQIKLSANQHNQEKGNK